MAIAYFIPDQAKLLAGRRQNRESANNHNNNSPGPTNSSTGSPAANSNPASFNRGYGTTINLTMPTTSSAAESAGCWDFLSQVFCHALRFYHDSSQIQPTVIQISVNFQSQTAANNNDNTASQENSTTANENVSPATENSTNAQNGNSPQQETTMPTAQLSIPRPINKEKSKANTNGKGKN
ncbi:cell death protein Grim [Stomoxys calcitrans]|uniref:cell death protein Grim n=1 Tax=Stomoxys calcitrans TaxID=35570 RepID=UPI0027E397C0|nr:cell death protein Grim [Stomoxys calcitrans]